MDRFDARVIPVYNSELITRINTAYQQETSQINSARKKLIEHIEREINHSKKQMADSKELGDLWIVSFLAFDKAWCGLSFANESKVENSSFVYCL